MQRKSVRTRDGVALSYLEGGEGPPLIMVPGWSQAATSFQHQFADLNQVARVIAVDMRGHGESEKPTHGYRIQRLAKDLFDLIEALGLNSPDVLGHSMGAAVVWSYLTSFGVDRPPRRLVTVDEPAALLVRQDWSARQLAETGGVVPSLDALADFKRLVLAAVRPEGVANILRPMFTDAIDEKALLDIARENLKLPRDRAATLLEDNIIQNWTGVFPTIRQPTLVISGGGSHIPTSSQRWIADTIPTAELAVIPDDRGGRHFMFFENPKDFNAHIVRFLTA